MAIQGTDRPLDRLDLKRFPDLEPLAEAWASAPHDSLLDLRCGPLADYSDDLVVLEADGNGAFIYLHYGENIQSGGGLRMLGKSTNDFVTEIGKHFAETYHQALSTNQPLYSVNKSKVSHLTHSWQRLILPLRDVSGRPKVMAFVRPMVGVEDILGDFARDTGFLGGTVEPIITDGHLQDFALLPLTDPRQVLGQDVDTLSQLCGRALEAGELNAILDAKDGEAALAIELADSMKRFGRRFVLSMSGGQQQAIFSVTDSTELIQARNAAEERRVAMEDFANTASDWMWQTDEDANFTYMSSAIEEQTGGKAERYIGVNWFDVAEIPENVDAFAANRVAMARHEPFRDLIYTAWREDGSMMWIRASGMPRFAANGTFLGYRGTGSNITAEIEARQSAQIQKQAMEDFATIASDWMWETDVDHRFTMMTDAVEVVAGRPASFFIGRSRFDYAPYSDNDGAFDEHRRLVTRRQTFKDFVYRGQTPAGEKRWFRVNGAPRFAPDGTFLGYRGTGSDMTAEVLAKKEADQQRQAMEDFANTGSDWMWESDADHKMTMLTQAVEKQTGYPPEHFIGVSRFRFADHPENKQIFEAHLLDIEAQKPFRDLTYKIVGADGHARWLKISGVPRFADDNTFLGYRGTGTNITDEVEAREQAARRAKELAEAHRLGRLGAWWYDRAAGTLTLSPEYLDLVGMPADKAVMTMEEGMKCFAPDSRKVVQASFYKLMRSKGEDSIDAQWITSTSKKMVLNVVARAKTDAQGRVIELFGTVQDITERKKNERALEALAFHDPLTGLGNRAYFSRELDEALAHAQRRSGQAGLLLLDLDHFKEVNDTLGHAAGDELLRRVGERLSTAVARHGKVFRLGGDEFAVLLPSIKSAQDMDPIVTSILSGFSGTVKLNEGSVHISTSIGMVQMPAQSSDAEETMRFADLALYEAKAEGRNRSVLFHEDLDHTVKDRVSLARDLRSAIANDELDAHFQLQVDVMSGRVAGFEALVRWNHPTRGNIPPDKFIPIAESSRLIADLGAWMVRKVCQQGRAWLDAGGAPLEMAVNLSVAQLWHRDVEADIRSALDETGFPPELLCVELTESVFSGDAMSRIQHLFARLKEHGVKIALDDFGTGYSSLQYLNQLSIDKLKIDRSFIVNCDSDPEQLRLLQGIVGLGRGLGLSIIVEGVETQAELQVICDLGCELVQGFLFARPKPFHEACLDAAQVEADYSLTPVLWKHQEHARDKTGDKTGENAGDAGHESPDFKRAASSRPFSTRAKKSA